MDLSLMPMLALALLFVGLLGGLVLVPLGLPGLWVMLGVAVLYSVLLPAGGIGWITLAVAGVLILLAEFLEFTIAGKYTKQYGGSKRASWGAIVGGLVGALVGVPIPVIGSLIGAFVGSFAGAYVGELTVHRDSRNNPTTVAKGALVGRAVAAAVKSAIGLVVAVVVFGAALAG